MIKLLTLWSEACSMLLNFLMKKWMDVHVVDMVTTITSITIITNIITTAIVKKTLVDMIITTNTTIITTADAKKTLVDVIITTNTTIITTVIAKKIANAKTKKESAIVEMNANVMMTITADAKLTNNHLKKIKRSLILTSFLMIRFFCPRKNFLD